MIDNYERIMEAGLLNFGSEDDFYFLQILQRKKEHPEIGSNSRVIKNYFINSKDYLFNRYEEIKTICNATRARAALRLNKRSYRKVAFKSLQMMANTLSNQEYEFVKKCYVRACGKGHNNPNKNWILDVDRQYNEDEVRMVINCINDKEPIINDSKFLALLPSQNGYHLITRPFNLKNFKDNFAFEIEVHKDNPTNLYIPEL